MFIVKNDSELISKGYMSTPTPKEKITKIFYPMMMICSVSCNLHLWNGLVDWALLKMRWFVAQLDPIVLQIATSFIFFSRVYFFLSTQTIIGAWFGESMHTVPSNSATYFTSNHIFFWIPNSLVCRHLW